MLNFGFIFRISWIIGFRCVRKGIRQKCLFLPFSFSSSSPFIRYDHLRQTNQYTLTWANVLIFFFSSVISFYAFRSVFLCFLSSAKTYMFYTYLVHESWVCVCVCEFMVFLVFLIEKYGIFAVFSRSLSFLIQHLCMH